MRTQINENQVAVRAKPHIFKILTSNRASTVGWNFGLAVVQPTDLRKGHDGHPFRQLNRSWLRRVLSQRKMRSRSVVIPEVRLERSS